MDLQIRATSKKHNMKISIVDITESIIKICDLQKLSPELCFVLSEFTISNVLISIDNKSKNKISSTYLSDNGAIDTITSIFENNNIRSNIKLKNKTSNQIDSENPIETLIGSSGQLMNLVETGLKEPYTSSINTNNWNMDVNFMDFISKSNQINSLIVSAVKFDEANNIQKAAGILIQLLPSHTVDDINFLLKKIGNTSYLKKVLLESTNYYDLVKDIVEDAKILETQKLNFKCSCSEEKVLNSLIMFSKKELENAISEKATINIVCEFCKQEFNVSWQKIQRILKNNK